jgi:rRNA maturation protein Rpf1
MMIHQFVKDLINTLQNREYITRWDIDSFNKNNVETIKNISKFVAMHFQLSQRDDTPYWKKLTMEKEYPNDYFGLSNQVYRDREFNSSVYACISVGLGYRPITPGILQEFNFFKDSNLINQLNPYFVARDQKRKFWKEQIDKAPTHYEYLKKNIYNEIN